MQIKFIGFTICSIMLIASCASGPCREDRDRTPPTGEAMIKAEVPEVLRVRVYKPDGSLQCGLGQAIALAAMQKELGTIPVYKAENLTDGQMRIQRCGTPTGRANVYEIAKSDLEQAIALGFKEWIW